MLKRLLALFIAYLLLIPASITALAYTPTTVEAPTNLSLYEDNGSIMARWTLPQSIINHLKNEDLDGDYLVCFDYKIDNGPWQYETDQVTESTYPEELVATSMFDSIYAPNDGSSTEETFFAPYMLGIDGDFDFTNHTYYFRVRFAFNPYDNPSGVYITSRYSEVKSIGKAGSTPKITDLAAPTNLKVEVKYNKDGKPYFQLNWTNPDSVTKLEEYYPIKYKIDFRVGTDKWFSETRTEEWWGSETYNSTGLFDPVEKDIVDKIVIEGNTYSFRIKYAYEPVEGKAIYSSYSNVAYAGIQPFTSDTSFAPEYLDKAFVMGLITDRLKGKNMSEKITREEFAELAVRYYEIITGKKAEVHPTKTFPDTDNPEILKAFNLDITAGAGEGGKIYQPKSLILRQQMATMIQKTLIACYGSAVNLDVSSQPDFKDQTEFADYAKKPAKFLAKYKITASDSKVNFGPNDNCSREQAIIFLIKSYDARDAYLIK
jgi:hypothetical protein